MKPKTNSNPMVRPVPEWVGKPARIRQRLEQVVAAEWRSFYGLASRPKLTPSLQYISFADCVLDRGREFESEPLTVEEMKIVFAAADSLGCFRPQRCFYNAIGLIMHDVTLTLKYNEGLAVFSPVRPLLHAWVTINNKVVDPTWRTWQRFPRRRMPWHVLGEFSAEFGYYGVELDTVAVLTNAVRSGRYDSFCLSPVGTTLLKQPRRTPPPPPAIRSRPLQRTPGRVKT